MLTAGQAHGGVMQGIGQALMEAHGLRSARPAIAGSYMDYALRVRRRADMSVQNHSVPCKTTSGRQGLREQAAPARCRR